MSRLKTEPPEPVRSLAELFAIAHGMEEESASRYAELAEQMHRLGNADVAAVFADLAEMERGHVTSVDQWSRQRTGASPEAARRRWRPPETFDEQAAAEMGSSRLATAYRALSMAVRNEESAFAFWSYVSAQAEDPEVRQAAEKMAQEELLHAWILRRERRRAFHAGRQALPTAATQGPQADVADPHRLEQELAVRLRELAAERASAGGTDDASLLRRMAEDSEEMAEELAAGGIPLLAAGPHPPVRAPAAGEQQEDRWHAALRLAELALERYMGTAEAIKDEAAMGQAQSLAERAIARYARLESLSGQAARG